MTRAATWTVTRARARAEERVAPLTARSSGTRYRARSSGTRARRRRAAAGRSIKGSRPTTRAMSESANCTHPRLRRVSEDWNTTLALLLLAGRRGCYRYRMRLFAYMRARWTSHAATVRKGASVEARRCHMAPSVSVFGQASGRSRPDLSKILAIPSSRQKWGSNFLLQPRTWVGASSLDGFGSSEPPLPVGGAPRPVSPRGKVGALSPSTKLHGQDAAGDARWLLDEPCETLGAESAAADTSHRVPY